LGDWIARGIDESVDTAAGGLVIGAAYLKIERGDGIVGGCDVGVEVGLGNVFG